MDIGKAFVQHFYTLYDTNRPALASLFQPQSMFTFENEQFQGSENIMKKLMTLPPSVKHNVTTADVQPSAGGGILVFVCGDLKIDQNENPIKFAEVFNLMPIPGQQGGFFVYNNLFRLNYG
eukprot:TRINITY_DN4133_c0_g1_i1.p1 TRINITY_DN4133_c0_g1~~TRINITY_DN4133_c0_g1_i1.p1  ORF type:complete len:121 (+),score=30.05 TRINITY_DN4133_c0_g1_i1:101-463(+)